MTKSCPNHVSCVDIIDDPPLRHWRRNKLGVARSAWGMREQKDQKGLFPYLLQSSRRFWYLPIVSKGYNLSFKVLRITYSQRSKSIATVPFPQWSGLFRSDLTQGWGDG
jgi:hypothetical protein